VARVLLVDDDDALTDGLSLWLGLRGHEVRTVNRARDVLPTAREFAPDLVLLDAILDGTCGATFAGDLAAAGVRNVVLCTGLSPRDLPPGIPVLEKPLRLELLEDALARLDG
jgi:two-component system response regulator MtrA